MCPTPARSAARVRLRAVASKNLTAARALIVEMFVASITASVPASPSASPFPDTRSIPAERATTNGSCPKARSASTVARPATPVPPATAIFTFRTTLHERRLRL